MPKWFLLQILVFMMTQIFSINSVQAYSTQSECRAHCRNGTCASSATFTANSGSAPTFECTQNSPPAPDQAEAPPRENQNETNACSNADTARQACIASSQAAVTACNEDNNSNLQATLKSVSSATAQADQIVSATGIGGACGVVTKAANTVSNAFLSFQQTCGQKVNDCFNSCNAVEAAVEACSQTPAAPISFDDGSSSLNTCKGLQAKQQTQGTQFQATLPELASQAAACKAATTDEKSFCAQNPTLTICGGTTKADCTNPTLAGSTVCACAGGIGSAACQMAMNGSQKLGSSSLAAVDPKLTGAAAGTKNAAPDFGNMAAEMAAGTYKGGMADDVGGKQGGNANLGGGGGGNSGAGSGAGGEAAPGINTNINGGYGRGGGGGSGFGGGSSGGGSGKGGSYGGVAGSGQNGLPNLNQFRPNMGFKSPGRRDLAGVVGPDGLLGPHADAFQMIKNRYNYEWRQGTLKP